MHSTHQKNHFLKHGIPFLTVDAKGWFVCYDKIMHFNGEGFKKFESIHRARFAVDSLKQFANNQQF